MALLEARDIAVGYRARDGKASLHDVSLALETGLVYDLTGPSGSGKTLLLRALARTAALDGGELLLNGEPAESIAPVAWRRQVCLVPQRAAITKGTVRDNLLLPWTLKVNREAARPTDDELEALLSRALLDVGLDREASRLSGGEAARIALLRAFATEPSVLLLDEVDAALDAEASLAVSELMSAFAREGRAVLRIRHRAPDGYEDAAFALCDGVLAQREREDGKGA